MRGSIIAALALVGCGVSAAAETAADPAWRVVTYPTRGELRYLPPVVSDADYPAKARRLGLEGRTVVRLVLSPAGKIVHCTTYETSGDAELDAQACAIYRARGRFELHNFHDNVAVRAPVKWELAD